MYEEDQKKVLSLYSELFDDAADDTEMAAFMVSPTRQAVALARTYNAKERKLLVNSTSRADELYEDEDETPEFLQVIEQLREQAEERGLFAGKTEHRSVWSDAPEGLEKEIPFDTPSLPEKKEETRTKDEPRSSGEKKAEPDNLAQEAYEDLTFDFSPLDEKSDDKPDKPQNAKDEELDYDAFRPAHREKNEIKTERKVNLPLAILFALFAVPVTVALVCLLLVPAFTSLGVSGLCLYVGAKVTMAALGSFAVFADVMVVLGSGIIILALGVLFLWIFIWFVIGAIAGLINGVLALGSKWCSKEVSAR